MKIHIKEKNKSPIHYSRTMTTDNLSKAANMVGGNLFDGTSQPTQQMQLGSAYWKQQARKPIFIKELAEFNKRKAEEGRQRREEFKKWAATKGKELVEKSQKDYLTTSNDNTWVENRNPTVKASKPKNPHLTERSVKGAKAHRAWEEEHPVLNTWENVLGAVPFVVASAPLAAAAGSGMAALGDAVAATSAGQAITAGLAPLATAASTNIAGAPLYTWTDVGLSSLFGGHGIQTAIDEGGISPETALEIAPLGRLTRPILNKVTTAISNYNYPLGKPYIPKNFSTIKPQVRTKVGDVEIDNPNLLYHLDRGNGVGAFSSQGAYIQDGMLFPGTPKESSAIPYSWWNKGKPYATSVNGQPMTRLVTTTKDSPGMIHVKSQNYPIGQWNGKRGFVLSSEYVNPKGVNVEESTYMLDPNYGWKRVLSKDIPTAKWHINKTAPKITSENAAGITPEQWTAAQDAAIAKGDMDEAQRLRDLHFKISAPKTEVVDINGNPQLVVHKTPETFTVFDNNSSIGKLNWFATPNAYGENGVFATGAGKNPRTMKLYVNMRNAHKPTIDEGMEPAYINQGEDGILGIVDKDMTNYFKSSHDAGKGFMMSGGVDNPNALKSADAVTYDNNGVRIPLGKRDNFKLNDIRYGVLPFGVSLTGYGLYKRKQECKMNIL